MKHLIIGTAGHIDHGKTTLVKALTRIDCDTHQAEKLRGITINLGFAHLNLSNGNSIGIVDVPGHKAFVNTMVAGACGIDFAMMVIAANSGVMPQTLEHLQILDVLGVKYGFVALTKIDLIDKDLLWKLEEDIAKQLKGSFLSNCKIIRISAKTGEGIEKLIDHFSDLEKQIEKKRPRKLFRMFIDRTFNVKGRGTVVTGSIRSGMVNVEDRVCLLPGEKEYRVRQLQRHGQLVQSLQAGDRGALNLVGLHCQEVRPGAIITNRILQVSAMIDVQVRLFDPEKKVKNWSQVIFILGTIRAQARIHLIDSNQLEGGHEAIAQIHLDTPAVICYGDHFVIRNTSGDITLGGGKVIDAYPLHHKRRTKKLVTALRKIVNGGMAERITAEISKRLRPVDVETLAVLFALSKQQITELLTDPACKGLVRISSEEGSYIMTGEFKKKMQEQILSRLERFHRKNKLLDEGMTEMEISGEIQNKNKASIKGGVNLLLKEMTEQRLLKKVNDSWALSTHNVELSSNDQKAIRFAKDYFIYSGMQTPLLSRLYTKASEEGIAESQIKQCVALLTQKGFVYNIENYFIHKKVVDDSRSDLLHYLSIHPEGIRLGRFRDLIKGSRKIGLLLLAQYEKEGIIVRKEDIRLISARGLAFIEKLTVL